LSERTAAAGHTAGGAPAALHAPVPTGNTYDKYGSSNPVVKRLMAGFERDVAELIERAHPGSIVDVGCGEGVFTERWAQTTGGRVVGVDLDDPKLASEWARRSRPNLEFRAAVGHELPYADGEFELAAAMEVLEHVPNAEAVLAEMARVASRWVLVSVPREPLWRALNIARGAYLRELGNTPGHLNHWSKRGFAKLVRRCGEVVELRSPLPWTMALVRVR
jgi:2-polyprenyl-3-methyl-5-hydroxy-6-metoxy-1,4-benzoquinol methylase